jgi:hypothetical protein
MYLRKSSLGVRLNWLKSRARVNRWKEEVDLLWVEMERVKEYFRWEEGWWLKERDRRRYANLMMDPCLAEGLEAYAARQGNIRRRMREHCEYLWMVADGWKQQPSLVPTGKVNRLWYSRLVKPDKSPALYDD